jgi:hypothetical protein
VDLRAGTARVAGHLPVALAHVGAELGGNLYVIGGSAPWGPSGQVLELHRVDGGTMLAGKLPEPVCGRRGRKGWANGVRPGAISATGLRAGIVAVRLAGGQAR